MESNNCVGCGESVSSDKNRRQLQSDVSKHVIPLWMHILNLEGQKEDTRARELVEAGARMCRKCFTAYDRCTKQILLLRKTLSKVVGLTDRTESEDGNSEAVTQPPPPKRLAISVGTSKASPNVMVQVNYQKKPRNYNLTPSRKRVAKAVARGSRKQVVSECMKDRRMQMYTIKLIGRTLRSEMAALCSNHANSMLRDQTATALTGFTWGKFYDELTLQAPTLLAMLESCTYTRKPRPNRMAIVGMCAAMLLKLRFQNMCLVQKIISLILDAGHSGKQVFQRLQKVNICLSHQFTTTLVNTLGTDHDKPVIEWRDSLAESLGCREDTLPYLGALAESVESAEDSSSQLSDSISRPSFSPLTSIESLTFSESDPKSCSNLSDTQEDVVMQKQVTNPPNSQPEALGNDWTTSSHFGYKLVGDNIDFTVSTRYMRVENYRDQSLHFFHCSAVLDRINFDSLSVLLPATCNPSPMDIALSLLPSKKHDAILRQNIAILISRILAAHMEVFQFSFSDAVTWHIHHKFYKEMSSKSSVIPLGILPKNENKGSEMVEILAHLHQYVPAKEYTNETYIPSINKTATEHKAEVRQILFGGDQLTAARARGSLKAMCNATTSTKRLEGLVPVIEDWHAEVSFLDVIWKYFFDTYSSREHGTLYQLKNLINRTHVTKPKNDFNACNDLFEIVITGHILAAAMDLFGMENLNDSPNHDSIPSTETAWMERDEERKEKIKEISMCIVDKFITLSFNTTLSTSPDNVYNYSIHLLSIGCLYLEMVDAIKEGDGERVLQCWQYLLQIFHNSGRKNYTIEAFNLLHQYYYKLPPRLAEQLKWSRFINTQGRPGQNIPIDLHQEHLNRLVKTSIQCLGANKTEDAVVRCSKALGPLSALLQQFDYSNSLREESGAHRKPSYKKDLAIILKELQQSKVFKILPGRTHSSFPKPTNVLHLKPASHTISWIITHLQHNSP